ncbi:MAG: hypothetical protein R6V05_02100 [Candidatus Brocadiia bacterium]
MRHVLIALLLVSCILWPAAVPRAAAAESDQLNQIENDLRQAAKKTDDARQKKMLEHAAEEMGAAADAAEEGNEEEAEKHKKKSLKWVTWAVKECMDPGDLPGRIADALHEEGYFGEDELERLDKLFDTLVEAKKQKEKSDSPFGDGMAINEIVQAILDVVDTGGFDGWHPEKALKHYLGQAVVCEDVQDMIERILDYLSGNTDDSGIPDMSAETREKAKKMVDELYKMKEEGASSEDIMKKYREIWDLLEEEGARVGRARKKKLVEDGVEEPPEESADIARQNVTTVSFTALQGNTAVNKDFIGQVTQVEFVAADGQQVEPKDAAADLDVHEDTVNVDLGKAARTGSVVLTGTGGVVRMLQGDGGAAAEPGEISPLDGTVEVRNGAVNETFNVPSGITDVRAPASEHTVSVGGAATQVVATQPNQVAVVGTGVPATAAGQCPVSVTGPGGRAISDVCPAWGYNVAVPPLTRTDAWVPVTIEVFGLEPDTPVRLTFLPEPGQQITPQEVIIMAGEAVAPMPVAELRAEKVGPQALSVVVDREEGP